MRIFLGLILIFTLASSRNFTISKQDFINQFSDSLKSNRIYCYNSKGNKVWLNNIQNAILTVQINNDLKTIEFRLTKTRFLNDSLIGSLMNTSNINRSISIKDISSIGINVDSLKEIPYSNLDSCKELVKLKNDSLESKCNKQKEVVLYLYPISMNAPIKDTICIVENACYHIKFKNKIKVNYGVIEKITMDSIYISNSFNKNTAKHEKHEYKILKYSIKDIAHVQLLKSNGWTFLNIDNEMYNFITKEINSSHLRCPCWFKLDESNEEISFYREWPTTTGYYGVREINGHISW